MLDNQNLGRLAECAQYQAQLQKNLMYLAAIADAQPQTPTMPSQMAPCPAIQVGLYMQHPQAASAPQPGTFCPKAALQFNNPHQMQEQQLHQQKQQMLQGQIGMRLGGTSPAAGPSDVRAGSKQDVPEVGTTGIDARSSSSAMPGAVTENHSS